MALVQKRRHHHELRREQSLVDGLLANLSHNDIAVLSIFDSLIEAVHSVRHIVSAVIIVLPLQRLVQPSCQACRRALVLLIQ